MKFDDLYRETFSRLHSSKEIRWEDFAQMKAKRRPLRQLTVLAAVIALLAGACVWGVFGRLETRISVPVQVTGGEASLVLEENRQVGAGAKAEINGRDYPLGQPAGNTYHIPVDLPDGVYQAEILVESVSPMSFVFN